MWNLSHSIARQAEQLCPGRVVYYIASPWPTDLDAHTAYWMAPAARTWLRLPKRWVGTLARKTLLSGVPRDQLTFAHVLCVSAFMQRYMVNEVGVPPVQTRVVYNGIDVGKFVPPDRTGELHESLRLLYAGGLVEHKGVHCAVEAIGHLVNELGVTDVHLTLVGAGHPAYVGRLNNRIRALGIEDFVTFHKRIPRSQMPALLRQYDVLVFPSIWAEPLARMVQEAMACGLVVIGTTTGGTPEILHDGENGLTFEAGNAPMLADKIAQVANDRALCTRLAQVARRTVEECFTLDRMVDEIEGYLTRVIDQTEQSVE